jgi:uncharacterized protein (TIGR00251 family)
MIISIKVIPGAKKQEVQQENSDFKVYLKSRPEKGQANEELINLLASHFNVPKTSVKIIKGAYSRNKLIEIET